MTDKARPTGVGVDGAKVSLTLDGATWLMDEDTAIEAAEALLHAAQIARRRRRELEREKAEAEREAKAPEKIDLSPRELRLVRDGDGEERARG